MPSAKSNVTRKKHIADDISSSAVPFEDILIANKTTPQVSLELRSEAGEQSELPNEIFELVHLEELKLINIDIKNLLKGINKLTKLEELTIINHSLDAFPVELINSSSLKSLALHSNRLEELPKELSNWHNLTYLNVSDCQALTDINGLPPNIIYIHIGETGLQEIPSIIFNCKSLQKIVATDLGLTYLPDALFELPMLISLFISDNNFKSLSSDLIKLNNLSELWVSNNQINEISDSFRFPKNLKTLDISNNSLSALPSTLRDLKKLEYLEFGNNKFSEIPDVIFHIHSLKTLNFANTTFKDPINRNSITYIPYDLLKLKKLRGLHVYGNEISNVPNELLDKSASAVKSYLLQLQGQEQDYLFEAKLLILGEPGAGKTSLTRKIGDSTCALPQQEETTRGIDVIPYYFSISEHNFPDAIKKDPERKFRLNIWDFGGQEIYKATHRFFLSNRAVYLLVADSRNEDTDFKYWLHIVGIFGGKSPLLIILNEKHGRLRVIDEAGLKSNFANIKDVLSVDLQDQNLQRLNSIKAFIELFAIQLPHIGSVVPAKWTAIRQVIVDDKRNMMTVQEYLALCKKNGITNQEDALVLSQYFHDIGVFLHFQKDTLLRKQIFLKPTWATNAVYQVLDHELLTQQKGRFSKEDAAVIWHEEEFSFVRDELLRLMQNFFLTYEISPTEGYIVPEKLSPVTPDYIWDAATNLILVYKYDFFMPRGLLTQFIVKMHRYIDNHDLVWRRGVVLHRQGAFAEVVETYESTVRVRIAGRNKRDFMTIIAEELDLINKQYATLKIEKLIPCNCPLCLTQKPYFYNFDNLQKRVDKGRQTIECGESYEDVNVKGLIDEVFSNLLRFKSREAELAAMQEPEDTKNSKKVATNKVFISYAHADQAFLDRLLVHFKAIKNIGLEVDEWADTRLKAGNNWRAEITQAMQECKVAILLISTDFLASSFIMDTELPTLLAAAKERGVDIIPIIVAPCHFTQSDKLSAFQAVNKPDKPLSALTKPQREKVYLNVTTRVKELLSPSK